jgi:uncharacterized repeat protein (TIGR01451 family)
MKNVLILLFLVFCGVASGQIIDFPDARLKNALVKKKCVDGNGDGTAETEADLNKDGEIDVSEALKVKHLVIGYQNIDSLNGIENFKKLESFYIGGNNITNFKIDGLSNLVQLNCHTNKLKKLDLTGFKGLKKLICNNNQIENLELAGLNELKYLNCSQNELNIINLASNVNLEFLRCENNSKLIDLNLKGLESLKYLYCTYNELKTLNINGCIKLEYVQCQHNNLDSLVAQNLPNLKTLICSFNGMTYLNVNGSYKLHNLECNANKLSELYMKTGRSNQFTNLYISFNSPLKYICCNIRDVSLIASKAPLGCEVNSYCTIYPTIKFGSLKGQLHFGLDTLGCNISVSQIGHFKYLINTSNVAETFYTNNSGMYINHLDSGTHTITPNLEHPSHFEVTPSSYTATFPSTSDTITQDFCITPKGVFSQTNITVIPLSPPARPGFDAKYKIVWENAGNQIESGTLNFTYDETLLDYISATQTEDLKSDGIVSWYFNNLLPFEKREITVTLKVNRPTDTPAVNAGDKLYLTASILDNIFILENTVVGSYDPNDKTCLQGDRVKPDMVGEYVDYLIRFENTGNYAAENVVVKDIIDTKTFDVSTLKITDASHEVYTRIEGNKVEFIFENIQLPFDDANNDGYIAFKIKTLPSLVLGDSLKNLADIYFDYNFPIRTNEAQTTVAFPVLTKDITTEVNIYPNPVTDILYLDSNDYWTKAEIYDISGRIMRSISLNGQSIDVSGLESGTYFVRLKDGEKAGLVKFVKI